MYSTQCDLCGQVSGRSAVTCPQCGAEKPLDPKYSRRGLGAPPPKEFSPTAAVLKKRMLWRFLPLAVVAIFTFAIYVVEKHTRIPFYSVWHEPRFLAEGIPNLFWLFLSSGWGWVMVAMGAAVVMASGGFDLSVGMMLLLAGKLYALLYDFLPWPAAALLVLAAGAAVGLVNGRLVADRNARPAVATCGTAVVLFLLACAADSIHESLLRANIIQAAIRSHGEAQANANGLAVLLAVLLGGQIVFASTDAGAKLLRVGMGNSYLFPQETRFYTILPYVVCSCLAAMVILLGFQARYYLGPFRLSSYLYRVAVTRSWGHWEFILHPLFLSILLGMAANAIALLGGASIRGRRWFVATTALAGAVFYFLYGNVMMLEMRILSGGCVRMMLVALFALAVIVYYWLQDEKDRDAARNEQVVPRGR